MQYLVTGATGTVGNKVATQLLSKGAKVRVGVRTPDKAKALADAGAEVVRLDLEDEASLAAAFDGVDRVFLLTAFVENPRPHVEAAVAAAKAAGVKHILRMSASGADASSDFALAKHHGEGEQIVKDSGIAWTVIQPTFFLDNLIHFAGDTIRGDGAFYGASGSGKTAYVSSDDIAASAAAILENAEAHAEKTYAITGGEAVSDEEIAAIIGAAIGKTVKYVDLEPATLAGGMKSQGVPEWMVEGLVGLEAVKANGWAAAISKAVEELTGRPPQTPAAFFEANKARLS